MSPSDLEVTQALHDRVSAALPQLSCSMVELEHSETRRCVAAVVIESTEPRKRDHVYRMTVVLADGAVHFYVHVHGTSKDLTTEGTQHFSKTDVNLDEVLAMIRSCWTGSDLS